MDGREAKDRLYEQFARAAKATANPKRIELLELLAQGEHSVDSLARATGMGVTNTSSHLQVLRQARLVETRKDGTKVFYRLAGDEVAGFSTTSCPRYSGLARSSSRSGTASPPRSCRTPAACCSARTSVGAIKAPWCPPCTAATATPRR